MRRAVVVAAMSALLALPAVAARAGGLATERLGGVVYRGIGLLAPTGSVPAGRVLHVGLSLASRDQAGADAAVRDVYDLTSPRYHRFFTPDEWDERFGPDPASVAAAVGWLEAGGLRVLQHAAGYVYAEGPAGAVQSLFGVRLRTFRVAGRDFFATLDAPRVPTAAHVGAVLGLSDFKRAATSHHTAGSGPLAFPVSASTTPRDLWSIYDLPAGDLGDGEGLAVFGWSMEQPAIEADLRQFEAENGLPEVPFDVRHFGGQPGGGPPGDPDGVLVEWDLDTQASSGMAPKASSITAYDADSPTDVDLLAPIAGWIGDPAGAHQGSASYGECEEDPLFSAIGAPASASSGTETAWNAVLQKGAAEGRSLFVAAGDTGFGCDPLGISVNGVTLGPVPYQSWPAVSPWVVAAGGTVVTTDDRNPPARDVEYAWTHGGGGPSLFVDQPGYQTGAGVPLPTRGVPDMAAQSGDLLSGFRITTAGADAYVGGTSLSAPLLQGMWARVNATSPEASGVGFANPAAYRHPEAFYDVTIGLNGLNLAKPGWDYTTGLGVPKVTALARALTGRTTPARPAVHPAAR